MKTFTCTEFNGHWPVGVAAIVVAPDAELAAEYLEIYLALNSIPQDEKITADKMQEVDTSVGHVIMLNDGDY